MDLKQDRLKKLREICESCRNCSLGCSRNKLVFGEGSLTPKYFSIAEAPGKDENKTGLPFVGRSGQLYRQMLKAINVDPIKDVFMCNVLNCWPPNNRTPEREEIEHCLPFLKKKIEIIEPKLLLLLGRTSVKALLPEHEKIPMGVLREDSKQGKFSYMNIPVLITYHPSALLMDPSKRPCAIEDFSHLQSVINSF
jgi:uracil-DNA glycosylase family 4